MSLITLFTTIKDAVSSGAIGEGETIVKDTEALFDAVAHGEGGIGKIVNVAGDLATLLAAVAPALAIVPGVAAANLASLILDASSAIGSAAGAAATEVASQAAAKS